MASRLYIYLFVFLFSGSSHAGDYFNSNAKGAAMGGYDPVAYFVLKMAIRGTDAHQTDWQGVRWYFSNENTKICFYRILKDLRQSLADGARWR
tara:strand:+ start:1409 stop:1687 length:279 start_codon:yes stop_codon:yes gene_type:complete